MSKTQKRRATAVTFALLIGLIGGASLHSAFVATEAVVAEMLPADGATSLRTMSRLGPDNTLAMSEGFADLAEAVTSGVSRIEVRTNVSAEQAAGRDRRSIPEPFQRFFDQAPGDPSPQPRFGGGTGFLVSSDGYIVTNDHVVGSADEIRVILSDDRSFGATLVGTDPTTDIAVIKIDEQGLHPLEWGNSTALRVGEWVMAVGNPGVGGAGQLDYTVTTGIVSAKGRPLQLIGQGLAEDPRYGSELAGYAIENFIQTDAVINPGNSGGPMVNMRGQVVGVNSAIASTDGYYQGYGFAVPADLARKVATDLIEFGEVRRAWLGVQVTRVSPEDAEVAGLPHVSGVLVQGVTDGGPALEAGLVQGDVIASVDGLTVGSGGELQELIAVRSQGERVALQVFRDGESRIVNVRLGALPSLQSSTKKKATPTTPATRGSTEVKPLGMTLTTLDALGAEQLGFSTAGGVVIERVDPAGPAGRRGIIPGLKLLRVDEAKIDTIDGAIRAFERIQPKAIATLLLESAAGQTRVVNVRAR